VPPVDGMVRSALLYYYIIVLLSATQARLPKSCPCSRGGADAGSEGRAGPQGDAGRDRLPLFRQFSTFPSPEVAAGPAAAARSNRKLKKAQLEDNGVAGGRAPARRRIAAHLLSLPAGAEPAATAKPCVLLSPVPVDSPGLVCRCHLSPSPMAGVARPTAAPVPAFGDGKDQLSSDLLLETDPGARAPLLPVGPLPGRSYCKRCFARAQPDITVVTSRPRVLPLPVAQRACATQILAGSFPPSPNLGP